MKRFILTLFLCSAMLAIGVFMFSPGSLAKMLEPRPAKENLIEALLNMPAPPPPNPLETASRHDASFYDTKNPPSDDAPIGDLVDYWTHQSSQFRGALYYLPKPSGRTVERLLGEMENDPNIVSSVLNILPRDAHAAEIVKDIYDRHLVSGDNVNQLKGWLRDNSPYFSDELERVASHTKDNASNYVDLSTENDVLALSHWDWDRAKPIVEKMYADQSQPVSKVLAIWALYKHALDVGDMGEADRYRSELMKIVENKSLADGVRDKANDALTHEADFPGRMEWTFSLFEDESLVKMPQYTMLTTLFMYEPPEKYVEPLTKMLESKNKLVRGAAVRCLMTEFDRSQNPDIARAMLPWLEDPKWIEEPANDSNRQRIVMFLQNNKMPESVQGLLAVLDEVQMRQVPDSSGNANVMSNANVANRTVGANNSAVNAIAVVTNTSRRSSSNMVVLGDAEAGMPQPGSTKEEPFYPFRSQAIGALGMQADPRAVPALRRLLNMTPKEDIGERGQLIGAILNCGGYSVAEQVDALEFVGKYAGLSGENVDPSWAGGYYANSNANIRAYAGAMPRFTSRPVDFDPRDDRVLLSSLVVGNQEPSEALVRAVIDKIEELRQKEPQVSSWMRSIIVSWHGPAISQLLLRDLKIDHAESAAVVRLLVERRFLKEKLSEDVYNAHGGTATATGLTACIIDEPNTYDAILESDNIDAKTAMLACGRLVRASLPVQKVAANLRSTSATLKSAAELYLESEDSPEARVIVLGLHPGDAKVLGAVYSFKGKNDESEPNAQLLPLFASVNETFGMLPEYAYNPSLAEDEQKIEQRLQKEVKEDANLLGVYAYDSNYVRIYKDKAVYSWEDDPSRSHERDLTVDEFNGLKGFMAANHVEDLKPFLWCPQNECPAPKQLLMLSRGGGSRVFVHSEHKPEFFAGLEKIFRQFRSEPSAIKYALSKDVPGLELLFANDDLEAQTVWKQGSDLRLVVSSKAVREKVDKEVSEMQDDEDASDTNQQTDTPDAPEPRSRAEKMASKRQYEGYSWHKITSGNLGEEIAQPAGVEYIPPRDELAVQPDEEQWKARTAAFEIRADDTGLYKAVRGKLTKLKEGSYMNPVISANGKWLIVNQFSDEDGMWVERYNLLTNRAYKLDPSENGDLTPKAYVPSLGKFLMIVRYGEEDGSLDGEEPDSDATDEGPQAYYFLDPETGAVTPAAGEVRPLAQQSFRPLQPTGKPNEFWASLPDHDKNKTVVGTYDARLLRFKPVLKLPQIAFNSMDMWADDAEGKIYFVYNGHLLSIPFKTTPVPVARPR
jgi:hypothetical protein